MFQLPWNANHLFVRRPLRRGRGAPRGGAGLGLTAGWCVATAPSSRTRKHGFSLGWVTDTSPVKQRRPTPLSSALSSTDLEHSSVTEHKVSFPASHSWCGKCFERRWVFNSRLTTRTDIFMCCVHSVQNWCFSNIRIISTALNILNGWLFWMLWALPCQEICTSQRKS